MPAWYETQTSPLMKSLLLICLRAGNEEAFIPPRPGKVLRGWDRAPVAAHAPRLQGHQVWKKPSSRANKHYDENEAQVELAREGAGARKKTRLIGARENINPAVWSRNGDSRALTPNNRKANTDVRTSPEKDSNSLLVPRKRTNNDHIITPRRPFTKRQSLLRDELRPKKAMRKSGRRSSLLILRDTASEEQALSRQETPKLKTTLAATIPEASDIPRTPQTQGLTQSARQIRSEQKPGPNTPKEMRVQAQSKSVSKLNKSRKTPARDTFISDGETSRSIVPTSAKGSTKSAKATPSKTPKTPSCRSAARSAAIEALLNSPGEAPPTLERTNKQASSPAKAVIVSPVRAHIATPVKMLEASDVDKSAEAIIETSVEVDVVIEPLDETAVAEQLEDAAILVNESANASLQSVGEVLDETVHVQTFVEPVAADEPLEAAESVEVADAFEIPEAHDIDSVEVDELLRFSAAEDFDVFTAEEAPRPIEVSAGFLLTDATRPFSFDSGSRSVLQEATEEEPIEEGDSDAFEESTSSPHNASTLLSPSNQLNVELEREISKSPEKEITTTAPFSYEQEDTDMLLSFVSRVKEAKKAAGIPKRKRSLPHSPLKLPLETIEDEGSTSPTPVQEAPSTGSPSKRRRSRVEEEPTPRRSTRTRLPVKTQLPAAPSFIPIRKLSGVEYDDKSITVRRNEDKELATLTRVNTKRNKAAAVMPQVVLEQLKSDQDPAARHRQLKEVFDERAKKDIKSKKGLSVRWAEELVHFQEFNAATAIPNIAVNLSKEAKKVKLDLEPVEEEEPEKRRVRVGVRSKIALGMAANGTPAPKRRRVKP